MLYKDPTFMVRLNDVDRVWKAQRRGIRQGCPLSPYLFIVAMTAMFRDVWAEAGTRIQDKRLPHMPVDNMLYADDTILVTRDTQGLHEQLWPIEEHSAKYGLQLNKEKCETLT